MSTPKSRGFQMPAEWHPHRRCWMAWPSYAPAYFGRQEGCKATYANVARAIARFEPVVMLANEADLVPARTLCGPAVEVRPVPIDDGWFRDNGPTFAIDGRGALLGDGNRGFFQLGRDLRGAGMSPAEIDSILRQEAGYGHHPSQRRDQIKSVIGTLGGSSRRLAA